MYNDDDLLMISGLQHLIFCARQCALIHLEGIWADNLLTAEGQLLHSRVDQFSSESRVNIIEATALRLKSLRLGLTGIADKVEFQRFDQAKDQKGTIVAAILPKKRGWWRPFPVEYKRGKPKEHRADEVQLCAQAICFEEMMAVNIDKGALFYGKEQKRMEVCFDQELRSITEKAAADFHKLMQCGKTPPAVYSKKCLSCSIMEKCLPKLDGCKKSAQKWLRKELETMED